MFSNLEYYDVDDKTIGKRYLPYFESGVFEDLVRIVDFIYDNLINHHEDIV